MRYDYIKLGDCLELIKELPDKSIDLVATDCPYRIVQGGCTNFVTKPAGGMLSRSKSNNNLEYLKKGKIFKHNDITFKEWLPEVFRVLKDNSHCYIFTNGRNLAQLEKESEKVGFIYQNLLVWEKGNATPNKWYMNACEFILMLRKGKAKSINDMGEKTILKIPNVKKKLHPTEKPVELMEILIKNSTQEQDIVLDPFMGSGSTCIACINTNRHYIGFELDEDYFSIARERIGNK